MAIERISSFSGIISLLTIIFSLRLPAYCQYSCGIGETNDPYQITTTEELMLLGKTPEDYDNHFIMIADIDLAAYKNSDFNIIRNLTSPFTGVFDGNNHTISNLNYTSSKIHYLGLFGRIHSSDTVIKNLGLTNCNVEAGEENRVGLLVGSLAEGRVNEYFADGGSVGGKYHVVGLVGYNSNGMILNLHANVTVSSFNIVGGLITCMDILSFEKLWCLLYNIVSLPRSKNLEDTFQKRESQFVCALSLAFSQKKANI